MTPRSKYDWVISVAALSSTAFSLLAWAVARKWLLEDLAVKRDAKLANLAEIKEVKVFGQSLKELDSREKIRCAIQSWFDPEKLTEGTFYLI
jgi:hypothetical protein